MGGMLVLAEDIQQDKETRHNGAAQTAAVRVHLLKDSGFMAGFSFRAIGMVS